MIPIGLYDLKTLEELNPTNPKFNGSFNAIGGRGQTNWVRLMKNEINFVKSVGVNGQLWNWAASDAGTLFIHRTDSVPYVDDVLILLSSAVINGIVDRQVIRIKDVTPDDKWVLVDAIPFQADGDYSAYTPDLHPEYWLKAYSAFTSHTYGPSHNGLMFLYPLFDPMSGFKISATAQGIGGYWVSSSVLHQLVQHVPGKDIKYEFAVINGQSCHIHTVDMALHPPFVTPTGFRTAASARATYKLSLTLNGDQWVGKLPFGRAMSNGTWQVQSTQESSIWFGRQPGQALIQYAKPGSYAPYNVISGPKRMIDNGIPTKLAFDNNPQNAVARQFVGLMPDRITAVVLTIEGFDGQITQTGRVGNYGATEQELCDIAMSFGFIQGMEMDSGESTQVSSPSANYHSKQPYAAQTPNQLGFH